jgi:hypothetical protein
MEASSKSFATTWSRQNGAPKALEEQFLAFQHVFVIIDAKNYSALEFRMRRWGHGSPSKTSEAISDYCAAFAFFFAAGCAG